MPGTTYVYIVAAVLNGNTVSSSAIVLTTRSDQAQPVVAEPIQPNLLTLTGEAYSSNAVEIFWNRLDIPGVTYTIFRDEELIREDSPAVSQFDSGLEPDTVYVYTVFPVVDGTLLAPAIFGLQTRPL